MEWTKKARLAKEGSRVRILGRVALDGERNGERYAEYAYENDGARERRAVETQRGSREVRRLVVGLHPVVLLRLDRGDVGEHAPHEANEERAARPAHVVRLRLRLRELGVLARLDEHRRVARRSLHVQLGAAHARVLVRIVSVAALVYLHAVHFHGVCVCVRMEIR